MTLYNKPKTCQTGLTTKKITLDVILMRFLRIFLTRRQKVLTALIIGAYVFCAN